MGEIKSAWELAMEKAERLGKLSPEELRRQKEEKYGSIGRVLADKYLGGLALWQLEVELGKYNAEEEVLVKEALASELIHAIELGNCERLQKMIEGILTLKQNHAAIGEIKNEIEQLFEEYEQVEEKESGEIEKSAREILHQLRISGSAIVAVNPNVVPEWQQVFSRLAQPYKERLEGLKEKLSDLS